MWYEWLNAFINIFAWRLVLEIYENIETYLQFFIISFLLASRIDSTKWCKFIIYNANTNFHFKNI